ncbi:hypothetical protein [Thioclava sp. JM3]|uniref:hypothetical protein n=1 Tax=Thioclava sp. JM3 TaxID=1973004 RepID=UPI00117C7A51|nr:hypothetical protein [Thioclava sp. JM3]
MARDIQTDKPTWAPYFLGIDMNDTFEKLHKSNQEHGEAKLQYARPELVTVDVKDVTEFTIGPGGDGVTSAAS